MTARVPKVGEKGCWDVDGLPVDIVAVDRDQVWVRRPTDTYGRILHVKELTPPEPTVPLVVAVWAEAMLEQLSDGTWRVTNLKDGQQ
jgi:hypothetical protein